MVWFGNRDAERLVRQVDALERRLAEAEAAHAETLRQLAYYQGIAAQLIRFSDSVAQLGESFDYLAGRLGDNLGHAREVAEAAQANQRQFDTLHERAGEMEQGLREVSRRVERLATRTQEINGIVDLIKGVASQTNLLALNAAIEAARAGESGRGFAVVAGEIRHLAERTAAATVEIVEKIRDVQGETDRVRTCIRSEGALAEGFSGSTETAVTAMQGLEELAGSMKREIRASTFRAAVELANLDELSLKFAVYNHLLGGRMGEPPRLPDERACRFGLWYYGEGRRDMSDLERFDRIERPHTEVHEAGRAALEAFEHGALEIALQHLQRMEQANLEVMGIVRGVVGESEARFAG